MTEMVNNDDARDHAATLNGDQEAFARLYDRHAAVVLSLCRQWCVPRSHAEAEDATQETFIRAYRKLDTLDDPTRLRPWLYGIARRVCSERRRAAGRRAKHEDGAMIRSAHQHRLDGQATSADTAEHAEQLGRLDTALDQLEDRERLAIHLYYLEADPVESASDALGLSRSGYYKLLNRAKDHLAALMREVKVT